MNTEPMLNRARYVVAALVACAMPACARSSPPATASAHTFSTALSAPSTGPASSPPNADTEATVLTDAERERDRALVPMAAAIVSAFSNGDAHLANDGKRFLFASNRSGLSELYVSSAGLTTPPTKITGGEERAISGQFTRDGKYVLFLRDSGADENFHIYRCRIDGADTVDRTPTGTLHRDDVMLPIRNAGTMVYTAHDPRSPETLLFVQAIESGEPKLVYKDPASAYGVDVSADGRRALIVRDEAMSEQVVLEVDLSSQNARRVYPPEGTHAAVASVVYAADAKRIFVATDEGTEQVSIIALDAKTLHETARHRVDHPSTATIWALGASPRGDMLAASIDAGTHTEARLFDARTLTERMTIKAPRGVAVLGTFTQDGKSLTLTATTPDTPADIYVVDTSNGVLKPLRDDLRPGFAELPALTATTESITAFDGLTIPTNVYVPKAAAPIGKRAVIAIFHGGPAGNAALYWDPVVRFFTAQGYAVVTPNIRGSTGFGRAFERADDREKRVEALKDVESVNTWIRAQSWADPDRIIIFGESYGGYVTLMGLTRQPALWRAGVDAFGPSDLRAFLGVTDQGLATIFAKEFGDVEKDAALLDSLSPLRDAEKVRAPLFVYQGQNDARVPRVQSDLIVAAMRRRGVPVEYMVTANEGHSMERRENLIAFLTRAARFLGDRMLGDALEAPRREHALDVEAHP